MSNQHLRTRYIWVCKCELMDTEGWLHVYWLQVVSLTSEFYCFETMSLCSPIYPRTHSSDRPWTQALPCRPSAGTTVVNHTWLQFFKTATAGENCPPGMTRPALVNSTPVIIYRYLHKIGPTLSLVDTRPHLSPQNLCSSWLLGEGLPSPHPLPQDLQTAALFLHVALCFCKEPQLVHQAIRGWSHFYFWPWCSTSWVGICSHLGSHNTYMFT